MSTNNKNILIIVLSFVVTAFVTVAYGDGLSGSVTPQLGGGISSSFDGGISPSGGGGIQPTGKILLVDGASFILKVDAASKICRVGGC